uniref:C2H2-type domain-containing protein n=1 Tax=Globodera rostochiensis TaxID=31243 RepID=A0A914HV94_GLORO
MFSSIDQSDVFAQIGAQQQQLLLSLSNQIIVGGMEIQMEKMDQMAVEQKMEQHIDRLLEEELKQKERRKCNELWTEFVAKMLLLQTSVEQQQTLYQPATLSLPSMSPFSTTSSVRSTSSSEPSTPTEVPNDGLMTPNKGGNEGMKVRNKEQRDRAAGKDRLKDGKDRVHKCDQCQKAFRFKSNLFEHKSLHLGSSSRNPFVCPFCSKTCRLKGNLKKHLQVHVTSAEDLECLWKRSFSRSSGRPSKNAPPAPLPKPGDDLGMVPVIVPHQASSSSSPFGGSSIIKWTLPQNQSVSSPVQSPKSASEGVQEVQQNNLEFKCEANGLIDGGSVLHSLLREPFPYDSSNA